MKNKELELRIESISIELKTLLAIEYGGISYDQMVKFQSFNQLNLNNRQKIGYVNYVTSLKMKLDMKEYIDSVLTLTKLLSLDGTIINKRKHLSLIIMLFNKVLVDDYSKYLDVFTNTVLLNNINKIIFNKYIEDEIVNYLLFDCKDNTIDEIVSKVNTLRRKDENRRF